MTTPLHLTCYYDLKAWAKKHRRSLLVAAGLVGGGAAVYYGFRYLGLASQARKERDVARAALLQREAEERAEAQLQSHFESIQRISDTTTLPSMLPQLKDRLFSKVDLSGLTEKLILGKEDPQSLSQREKMQLWQELKTLSFVRTVCAMSALSLLDLFIRIQLNILGRHVYFDTARDFMNPEDSHVPLSMSVQHKFIAYAGYLHHKGLDALVGDVNQAAEIVLRSKPLKEPYTLDDLRDVFMRIRATLDSKRSAWVQYVLPPDNVLPDDLSVASSADASNPVAEMALNDNEVLDQLMNETRAVLVSNEFHEVMAVCVDSMLDGVMEELYAIYRGSSDNGIPLAKLLPPVAGAGSALLESLDDNRFIRILADLPQVHAFCALVYTNSSEETLA
ncbi:peroxisome biogenesis protein 3-2 isoform X2 [Physcomitrium patens]|uniref:Peroxin-3 n=1 Tax=Physcomitrium patens TaxID=3218 RepID=A0A2K1IGG5_PHYPA|nr:peroxisome biogenesis protein 3-2-like isoform X2 [Physcomitrium patens]PNR28364.1 hypothetical protein PHYPA_028956 [Physcomitrium patens]|eukprot:XP_024363349.1 peroxisome biogenesis protein 3-2-like isoform X2 [Physcomitrella patens]